MEREHGRIVSVSTRTLGSTLTADVAAGVTDLPVFDAADFNPRGGHLRLSGDVLEYVAVDDDASLVTLAAPLPAAAEESDRVRCWSTLYDVALSEMTAMVQLDGDDDNPDPLEATVPHFLVDKVSEGDRGGPGESVVLEYDEDGDEWRIVDILGLADPTATGTQFKQDRFTVDAVGDQTFTLTHEPITHSEHLYWNGLYQPNSEWSRSDQTVTVADTNSTLVVGDEVVVEYAYKIGFEPPSGQLFGFGADGWAYLQVPIDDPADYSAETFDDSGWTVGRAGFGTIGGTWNGSLPPPSPIATTWTIDTRLWLRRTVAATAGVDVTITITIEDNAVIWWNGQQVASIGSSNLSTFTIPGASVLPQNVIAVRATDDPPLGSEDDCYVDLKAEQ